MQRDISITIPLEKEILTKLGANHSGSLVMVEANHSGSLVMVHESLPRLYSTLLAEATEMSFTRT